VRVHLAPGATPRGGPRRVLRVDPYTLHLGQVNDNTAVTGGVAGEVVATTAYRHQQVVHPGKTDRGDDIRHASAAHDHGRMAVNHAIPDFAGVFITGIPGTQQRAP